MRDAGGGSIVNIARFTRPAALEPVPALPPVSSRTRAWRSPGRAFSRGTARSRETGGPLVTEGFEGFSIDYPEDFELAERVARRGEAELPRARSNRDRENHVPEADLTSGGAIEF